MGWDYLKEKDEYFGYYVAEPKELTLIVKKWEAFVKLLPQTLRYEVEAPDEDAAREEAADKFQYEFGYGHEYEVQEVKELK